MSDDNQLVLPRSFIELFMPHGAIKPIEPRHVIAERYDLCEDMAQMLSEDAGERLSTLPVTQTDVLERMHRGLLADTSPVSPAEARWIVYRVAELRGWPMPTPYA